MTTINEINSNSSLNNENLTGRTLTQNPNNEDFVNENSAKGLSVKTNSAQKRTFSSIADQSIKPEKKLSLCCEESLDELNEEEENPPTAKKVRILNCKENFSANELLEDKDPTNENFLTKSSTSTSKDASKISPIKIPFIKGKMPGKDSFHNVVSNLLFLEKARISYLKEHKESKVKANHSSPERKKLYNQRASLCEKASISLEKNINKSITNLIDKLN